jgi:hypothetical protein
MAGEYLLVNPRRKRRARRKTRKTRKNPRRRHRIAYFRPRRRRRSARRRNPSRRRHHIRRNPAMRFMGMDLGMIGWGAVGAVGGKLAGGFLYRMLPAEMKADTNTAPLLSLGASAAAGIGVPMLLKQFRVLPKPAANAMMLGAAIVLAVDLLDAYVLPKLGLGTYELGAWDDGQLVEVAPDEMSGVYTDSVY